MNSTKVTTQTAIPKGEGRIPSTLLQTTAINTSVVSSIVTLKTTPTYTKAGVNNIRNGIGSITVITMPIMIDLEDIISGINMPILGKDITDGN